MVDGEAHQHGGKVGTRLTPSSNAIERRAEQTKRKSWMSSSPSRVIIESMRSGFCPKSRRGLEMAPQPIGAHDGTGIGLARCWLRFGEASDRVCSKRLVVMLPVLLPVMERHGRVQVDDAVRAQLLAVSAATIDRLLADTRAGAQAGRRRRAGQSSAGTSVGADPNVRRLERPAAGVRRGRLRRPFWPIYLRAASSRRLC